MIKQGGKISLFVAWLIVLLITLSGDNLAAQTLQVRIINGTEVTEPNPYLWLGALHEAGQDVSDLSSFHCGASLIAANYGITAAHCVYGERAANLQLTFGRRVLTDVSSGVTVNISRIVIHPDYDPQTSSYDAAILELAEPVSYTPVMVIPPGLSMSSVGGTGTTLGWGLTSNNSNRVSNVLRQATLMIRSDTACLANWGSIASNGAYDSATMFCAGTLGDCDPSGQYCWDYGIDTCSGDSGGPVLATWNGSESGLIGLTSSGSELCGGAFYGLYTRLTSIADWVYSEALGYDSIAPVIRSVINNCSGKACRVRVRAVDLGTSATGVERVRVRGNWTGIVCTGKKDRRVCKLIKRSLAPEFVSQVKNKYLFKYTIRGTGMVNLRISAVDANGNKSAVQRFSLRV